MEILKAIKRHFYLLILILVAVYLVIDLNTRLSTLSFLENQEARGHFFSRAMAEEDVPKRDLNEEE